MYLTEGRLYDIQAKIKHICIACDRKPEEIRILPVTKTHSTAVLQAAFSLGLHRFGENKIQEAQQKARVLQDLPVRWCMIGHLQTNKAKYAARFADEVHSLDSIKLAKVLEQHLQKLGRSVKVLLQVNSSGEPQKHGLAPDAVLPFVRELSAFPALQVEGLMTMAMFSQNTEQVHSCFRKVKILQERLRQEDVQGRSWNTLSMGMSHDFPVAIAAGATEIRLGQALFGERPL